MNELTELLLSNVAGFFLICCSFGFLPMLLTH